MTTLKTELLVEDSRNSEQWLARVATTYHAECDALLKEISNETVSYKKKIHVAGFEIPIDDMEQVKGITAKIVNETEVAANIRKTLANVNIDPIGILPSDMFKKIVNDAGLYTFRKITKEGKVNGDGKNYQDHYRISGDGSEGLFYLGVIGGLCLWIIVGVLIICLKKSFFLGCLPIIIGIYNAVIGFIINNKGSDDNNNYPRGLSKVYLITNPLFAFIRSLRMKNVRANAKKYLWPSKTNEGKDFFKIILPLPPEHIRQALLRCHTNGIETFLIVDKNAFEVGIDSETAKMLQQKYPPDPIIAYEYRGMTAIIAQFGDFKGEKQVIQYIKDHFTAIRNDLFTVQKN